MIMMVTRKKGLVAETVKLALLLYNAVAKVNGIKVTERHNHSNRVPYAKSGKDARCCTSEVMILNLKTI